MSGFFAAGLFTSSIAFLICASMSLSCAKPGVVVTRAKPASKNNRRIMRLLLLCVAEKTALSDDRSYLRWHHFVPALVPARDALEHVAGKDRQIFRVEIIELDE